jgi:hypothetical protein
VLGTNTIIIPKILGVTVENNHQEAVDDVRNLFPSASLSGMFAAPQNETDMKKCSLRVRVIAKHISGLDVVGKRP